MLNQFKILFGLFLLIAVFSCGNKTEQKTEKVFEKLTPQNTGVSFINAIPENDSLNQEVYHYLYNGNGVATGDLNNDGLPEIIITGNEKPAKLFLNKGEFKFEDITQKSGLKTGGWMSGVNIADVNNDGFLDIYICKSGPDNKPEAKRNLLFINNKNLSFTESAKDWGIDDAGNATCANFFDMDNDGDLDMYLGNHANKFFSDINTKFTPELHLNEASQQHLYKNEGNKFVDVSAESGVKSVGYCLSATTADFNRDGLIDIYVCNDYHIPDFYYVNMGNGKFKNMHSTYFSHASANSMGADFADYNNDGWLDLITLDMLVENPQRFHQISGPRDIDYFNTAVTNGYGIQYMKNTLQTNRNGYFSDYAHLAGVAKSDWSWSPLFADFNNDGLQDLFITNGYYREVTNIDYQLYKEKTLSKKGIRSKEEIVKNVPQEKISNYMFQNKGNYTFKNVAEEWGVAEPSISGSACYSDLNNDGKLDLIICNQGDETAIYKNISSQKNYLNIQCKGGKKNNIFGYGTKIFVTLDSGVTCYEMQSTHGYQGACSPIIHVGLGGLQEVKKIEIIWPNGEFQELLNVKANQLLTVNENDAKNKYDYTKKLAKTWNEIGAEIGIDFTHQENTIWDFKTEFLLPRKYSEQGPGVSTADVNGDGYVDVFIGNSMKSAGGKLFVQNSEGKFTLNTSQPWATNMQHDNAGSLFFDADNDGDFDLYIAAGGNEMALTGTSYGHHLYFNDGKGNFSEKVDALKNIYTSGSCVAAGDVDMDGDLDLFLGGRIVPGAYPINTVRSYILINNKGIFSDETETICKELVTPGLICAAVFCDYNNDGKQDLIIGGEFNSIQVFKNNNGSLLNATKDLGLLGADGFYNSIITIDVDNDGDMDFVCGNKGLNSYEYADEERPLKYYFGDFDNNQRLDILPAFTWTDKREYMLYQIDELAKQYPTFLRKKYTSYNDMAKKSVQEIFGEENLKNYASVNQLNSLLIINDGEKFTYQYLPKLAQAGPIFGMTYCDIDNNGYLDIIGVGNSYAPRVTWGNDDAMNGFVLFNNKGKFTYSDGLENGFVVRGNAKGLSWLPIQNKNFSCLVTQNNSHALVYNFTNKQKFIPAKANEFKAIVKTKFGIRNEEINYGSGYLSSQAAGVWANETVTEIEFIGKNNSKRLVKL